MASSSYRPLPKVPVEFSTQSFVGKRLDRVLPLWHASLHSATLPGVLHWRRTPRGICRRKCKERKVRRGFRLLQATRPLWTSSTKTRSRWVHRGVINLMHKPLWRRGFSSCHQVTQCKLLNLQSAELTPGVVNQTPRRMRTTHCISGHSVVVCSAERERPHLSNKSLLRRRGGRR